MKLYELGGVKFIVHEGDVYTKYDEGIETESESNVKPARLPRFSKPQASVSLDDEGGGRRGSRGPRTCKTCGELGHTSKTCSGGNPAFAKVKALVDQGASDEEVRIAMNDRMTAAEIDEALAAAHR